MFKKQTLLSGNVDDYIGPYSVMFNDNIGLYSQPNEAIQAVQYLGHFHFAFEGMSYRDL